MMHRAVGPAGSGGVADLYRQTQANIGALNRDDDREQDNPGFVGHWHCRHILRQETAHSPMGPGAIIDEFAAVFARGWSAALPGYTLAPDATFTQIVQEVRDALDWLAVGQCHFVQQRTIIQNGHVVFQRQQVCE
jgi:hypothetical protein